VQPDGLAGCEKRLVYPVYPGYYFPLTWAKVIL